MKSNNGGVIMNSIEYSSFVNGDYVSNSNGVFIDNQNPCNSNH